MSLPDIQNNEPRICIKLNRVGVSDLTLPVSIRKKDAGIVHTVSKVSCYVNLDAQQKGINMSRLPRGLHDAMSEPLTQDSIKQIAENIRLKSEAEVCEVNYNFQYFIEKLSPVNREPGLVNYDVTFTGIKSQEDYEFIVSVTAIATSLCPCSKEISSAGAHNQKCYITIESKCKPNEIVWIEDLIRIAENASSCEIYSILKRPDEKFVTEQMYNNPQFVEDVARECYPELIEHPGIAKFKVRVESDESIHVHKAIAMIET